MTRLDFARLGAEIEPKSLTPDHDLDRLISTDSAEVGEDGRSANADDQLLTPREVADLFGVRTTTVARWARDGKLQPIFTPGGHRRYWRADAQALLDESELSSVEDREKQADDAARLYAQGWSIRQVADRFDCSYGAMRRILLRRTSLRGRRGS